MLSNADLADAIACVVRFRASSIANNDVERWLRAVSLRKKAPGSRASADEDEGRRNHLPILTVFQRRQVGIPLVAELGERREQLVV
jgi:hypothetical protein